MAFMPPFGYPHMAPMYPGYYYFPGGEAFIGARNLRCSGLLLLVGPSAGPLRLCDMLRAEGKRALLLGLAVGSPRPCRLS
jgi:hypothetical protein